MLVDELDAKRGRRIWVEPRAMQIHNTIQTFKLHAVVGLDS
jgi:hypothetical protein